MESAAAVNDTDEDRRALRRAVVRRSLHAEVLDGCRSGIYRVKRHLKPDNLVSIVIPTRASNGLIKTCITSLREKTTYRNFEIICVENLPKAERKWKRWVRRNADLTIELDEEFNWSRFNNIAAERARGDFLLFLNDDTEVLDSDWLTALLEHGQRKEVGAVGGQLLYPDLRVQHAGMFLADQGRARHAFRFANADDPGYFGLALTQRNVISVTGACLLTRQSTFQSLGRFDEDHAIVNNDVDYCLRAWRRGLLNVYTPFARLIHHEGASRYDIPDQYNVEHFGAKWSGLFELGDPYFHERLSRQRDDFSVEWEPVRVWSAGHPVFDRESIRKILIVKLDHIGDCILALPAVRRLNRHFPNADLFVLSGRAAKSVWPEPLVKEVIEFDFYHARSSLGQLAIETNQWQALSQRLNAYGFDLAIDLRKHQDTRPVLQHTGARYLAGFDHRGRFPWLDIALEWSDDQAYVPKRQHVKDDLINLVDTVSAAADVDDNPIALEGRRLVFDGADELFSKAVVCVHAASGNEMRQWPSEHFVSLINLLTEDDRLHVALIGGSDDHHLISDIQQRTMRPEVVWSVVGKLKLDDIPLFISRCALFVGNNSGPQHIAASVGTPTIGIHSGVVDSREWGPIGARAVAVSREMTCSPCYLLKLENCHRNFACLRQLEPVDVLRQCKRMLTLRAARHNIAQQGGRIASKGSC
jgi:ADP-heptose:LPS heptosyltransferase/GT2 family glycosyltransferase